MSIVDSIGTGECPTVPEALAGRRARRENHRPDDSYPQAGDKGGMSYTPPVIASMAAGGPAYLVQWDEIEPRTWCAVIVWLERAETGWRTRRATVEPHDLTEIQGQDYRTVPRYRLRDRFRPGSPASPRAS